MNVHTTGVQQLWRHMWGPWHNANVHSRCCPNGEDDQVHCPQQQLDSAETPPPQTAPNSFSKSSILPTLSFLHVFSHLKVRKRPSSPQLRLHGLGTRSWAKLCSWGQESQGRKSGKSVSQSFSVAPREHSRLSNLHCRNRDFCLADLEACAW